jgi:hypothetical protein
MSPPNLKIKITIRSKCPCNPKTPNLQFLTNPTLSGKITPPLTLEHLKMGG